MRSGETRGEMEQWMKKDRGKRKKIIRDSKMDKGE